MMFYMYCFTPEILRFHPIPPFIFHEKLEDNLITFYKNKSSLKRFDIHSFFILKTVGIVLFPNVPSTYPRSIHVPSTFRSVLVVLSPSRFCYQLMNVWAKSFE